MLNEYENIVVGKLCAIINGVTAEGDINSIKSIVIEVTKAIREKSDLKEYASMLTELKVKLLPDCMSCMYPCGRTNDFLINSLEEPIRSTKLKDYKLIIEKSANMNFEQLAYEYSRLTW